MRRLIIGISAVTTVALASCGASDDHSSALAGSIKHDGTTQLQQNLTTYGLSATATAVVTDASCVQTAGTQNYTCMAHYTVNDPANGLSNQKYVWNLTGTCDSAGSCQWHAEGGGHPVSG